MWCFGSGFEVLVWLYLLTWLDVCLCCLWLFCLNWLPMNYDWLALLCCVGLFVWLVYVSRFGYLDIVLLMFVVVGFTIVCWFWFFRVVSFDFDWMLGVLIFACQFYLFPGCLFCVFICALPFEFDLILRLFEFACVCWLLGCLLIWLVLWVCLAVLLLVGG